MTSLPHDGEITAQHIDCGSDWRQYYTPGPAWACLICRRQRKTRCQLDRTVLLVGFLRNLSISHYGRDRRARRRERGSNTKPGRGRRLCGQRVTLSSARQAFPNWGYVATQGWAWAQGLLALQRWLVSKSRSRWVHLAPGSRPWAPNGAVGYDFGTRLQVTSRGESRQTSLHQSHQLGKNMTDWRISHFGLGFYNIWHENDWRKKIICIAIMIAFALEFGVSARLCACFSFSSYFTFALFVTFFLLLTYM